MPRIVAFKGARVRTWTEPIDDKMIAGLARFEKDGRVVSAFRLVPARLGYRARSYARYHLARVMRDA